MLTCAYAHSPFCVSAYCNCNIFAFFALHHLSPPDSPPAFDCFVHFLTCFTSSPPTAILHPLIHLYALPFNILLHTVSSSSVEAHSHLPQHIRLYLLIFPFSSRIRPIKIAFRWIASLFLLHSTVFFVVTLRWIVKTHNKATTIALSTSRAHSLNSHWAPP